MSISKASMKCIAEALGLSELDDNVAEALAQDVEFRLRDVMQEALKFMTHARRHKLTAKDINSALASKNVEQLYGFSSSLPTHFRAVGPLSSSSSSSSPSTSLAAASSSTGSPEKSSAASSSSPAAAAAASLAAMTGAEPGEQLFYVEDETLTFESIVNTKLPVCPNDIQLTCHWLAIDGVQPAIRQNPSSEEAAITLGLSSSKRKRSSAPGGASSPSGQPHGLLSSSATSSSSSSSSSSSASSSSSSTASASSSSSSSSSAAATATIAMSGGGSHRLGCIGTDAAGTLIMVEHKPLVKHVLSKELQAYYDTVTEAIKSDDARFQDVVLDSIRYDCGLQQLTPYFSQFILDEVSRNLLNLPRLRALLRMTRALLDATEMHIEPYLHQLMPAVLTCVVGRRLGSQPADDDHWSLRDYAAQLVEFVCRRYASAYPTLQPRTTQTLLDGLDPARSLTTHYGALVGLSALGVHVVELLLVPNAAFFYRSVVDPALHSADPLQLLEAEKVRAALLDAVGRYFNRQIRDHASALATMAQSEKSPQHQLDRLARLLPSNAQHIKDIRDIFGANLDPYLI